MTAGYTGRDLSRIVVSRWRAECGGCLWRHDWHHGQSKATVIRHARGHVADRGHVVTLLAESAQAVYPVGSTNREPVR